MTTREELELKMSRRASQPESVISQSAPKQEDQNSNQLQEVDQNPPVQSEAVSMRKPPLSEQS